MGDKLSIKIRVGGQTCDFFGLAVCSQENSSSGKFLELDGYLLKIVIF